MKRNQRNEQTELFIKLKYHPVQPEDMEYLMRLPESVFMQSYYSLFGGGELYDTALHRMHTVSNPITRPDIYPTIQRIIEKQLRHYYRNL